MKKYIIEVKGAKVSPEFEESITKFFDDNSRKVCVLYSMYPNVDFAIKELCTDTGNCREVETLKPGLFRRVVSYFI